MTLRRLLLAVLASALIGLGHSATACEIRSDEAHVSNGTMPYITSGQGPAVLLIHGLFAQKEQWREVLCALADAGYQAVAPDLPGYGQSQGYSLDVYPLEAQARLLQAFTRQIGIRPQHVAGNSMGGAIAALVADANPDSIRSLGFIGGTLGIGPWASTVQASILAGNNPFIPLTPEALDAELAMLLVHTPTLTPDLQKMILAPYQQHTTHYIQVWNIVNLYGRILADRSATHLPTLILWGEDDHVFSIADSAALAKKYPHHHRQNLLETGHLAMVDAPEVVSRAYLAFLKQLPR